MHTAGLFLSHTSVGRAIISGGELLEAAGQVGMPEASCRAPTISPIFQYSNWCYALLSADIDLPKMTGARGSQPKHQAEA